MLKEITKEDESRLPEAARLELLCFKRSWNLDDLQKELHENPFSRIFLYENEMGLIGYGIVWKIFEQGSIARIGIHPDFRKQGYGKRLLYELIKSIQDETLEQITLEVDASNEAAIAMYNSFGFVPVRKIEQYYSDGSDAIFMIYYPNL